MIFLLTAILVSVLLFLFRVLTHATWELWFIFLPLIVWLCFWIAVIVALLCSNFDKGMIDDEWLYTDAEKRT